MKVTVYGAGVAGLSAALALRRDGHDVSVLEARSSRQGDALEVIGEEFVALLTAMGIPDLPSSLDRVVPIESIATGWPGKADLEWAAAFRPTERRWALVRSDVAALLRTSALALGIPLTLADRRASRGGREDLVVDATGAPAAVARRLDGQRVVVSEMIAVFAAGRAERLSRPIVEAGMDGWWFAVGDRDDTVVTYFTDADEAGRILTPKHLAKRMATTSLLAKQVSLHRDAPLSRRSAMSSFLDPVAGPRWAAVGDAALTHDPLASYGLTFAVQSANHLRDACAGGEFRVEDFRQAIELKIARYRIARQRLYLSGAEAFGRPFWRERARLVVQTT